MKTAGWIAIVVLILLLIYIWLRMIYNRITFEFGFRGADLSGLNIQDILSSGQTEATIKMSAKIVNNNSFSITISNLQAWLYYENTLIAKTPDSLSKNTLVVPAKGSAEIATDVTIYLNKSSVKLLKEVALKKSPKVKYTVKMKIWGVNITWEDYFIWEM